MIDRRNFIKVSSILMAGQLMGKKAIAKANNLSHSLHMPDESHQHQRTWMAFVANEYIWSRQQIPEVKKNLILIAQTIAKYDCSYLSIVSKGNVESSVIAEFLGCLPPPIPS